MSPSTDLLQGTLDVLILKTLALEPMHGWGVALRIQQVSKDMLQIGRLSLPGTASAGIQGLDSVGVGKFREQPTSKILLAYPRWQEAVRS